MPALGALSCDKLSGSLPALKERVEVWYRPGYDGVGAQRLGRNDGEGALVAVKFADAAGLRAWYASLQALQGQVVAVSTSAGESGYCLIQQVGPLQLSPWHLPGTIISRRGEAQLQLCRVPDPA